MSTPALRLPGITFVSPPQVEGAGLPALDVMAFAGFAERGPLDLPVAIDDINMYRAIFGGDLALARGEGGRIFYANLPRAVAAFFATGGRRCYVVRLAGEQAKPARCQVPGLVAISPQDPSPRLVWLYASSPGRWGNLLRLATRLLITPLPATKFALRTPLQLDWQTGSAPQAIQVGDLLRLTFDGGLQWLFPVNAIGRSPSLEETGQALLEAAVVWQPITTLSNISPALQVERIDRLNLDRPLESPPSRLRRVERLRFELRLRVGDEYRLTLTELAFNAGHPRFWGEVVLPESSILQRQSLADSTLPEEQHTVSSTPQTQTITAAAQAARLFRALQADRRLDPARDGTLDPATLAGLLAPLDTGEDGNATTTFLPLGMLTVDGEFSRPTEDDQGNDDLANFNSSSAGLFMDDYLVPNPETLATFPPASTLLTVAADRYYLQNHRLKGLHSLLFVDEVALLSVPDAVHLNWQPGSAPQLPSGQQPGAGVASPSGDFADCRQPPRVVAVNPATGPLDGNFEVTVTGSGFIPDPATTVQFADTPARSVQVLDTTALRCRVPPAGQSGPVTVAVKNTNGTGSAVAAFTYQPESTEPTLPEQVPATAFDLNGSPLLLIQRAVLDFCQARTDVVGILSLPAHFEKRQCIEWQETWRQQLHLPPRGKVFTDVREIADLSYVAVYHPWLLMADSSSTGTLKTIPPEGAVGGMIAARERARQVWVAPANVPLTGVLDLTPRFSEDDWAELFALQFNLIRQQPRGFYTLSAYTLSDERDLLQLSVRRLLILLRKVVVEQGMDSVFESNREAARSALRLALENLLRRLFEQGAFAGDTQPAAFRVRVDASLNPPQTIEQGQLLVQIQVAPSQPLEFIEVLLLRTGEGLQAVEV